LQFTSINTLEQSWQKNFSYLALFYFHLLGEVDQVWSGLPRHVPASAHDWGPVLTFQGKIGSYLLFSLERLNELSFFLKERGYIGQDNCTAATSFIVGFTIGLLEHLDDANIRACITNESPESDRLSR